MYTQIWSLVYNFVIDFCYRGYRDKTGRMLSPSESLRPLVSTLILFALMLTWARFSSYEILQRHPRIFYCTTGTVFSNIAVSISWCGSLGFSTFFPSIFGTLPIPVRFGNFNFVKNLEKMHDYNFAQTITA